MSIVINSNITSMRASNELSKTNNQLANVSKYLSTGSRLDATKDAAGLAVAKKVEAAAARTNAVKTNVTNIKSFLDMRVSSQENAGQIVKRISELATLYTDITKSASDKTNYSTEFLQLKSQLTSIASSKFNGVSLFGSSSPGDVKISEDGTESVTVLAADLASKVNTITAATTLSGVTIANTSDAISELSKMQAEAGAQLSRFEFIETRLGEDAINLKKTFSSLADTNIGESSAEFTRLNILTQAGTSMLAQANQSPQSLLRLLQ